MAITVFISLYSTRLVLAALGVTDFGIFNVVAGTIAMLTFLNAAMTTATQRFMSYAEGKGDYQAQVSIFNVSVLLHWVIAFAVVLLLELAALFLFDGILEIPEERMYAAKVVFQCMVFSTFFKIISVPYDAVINAHENMFLVAVLGVLEAFLKLGIALYITFAQFDGLISYGVLMALMAVVLLLIRRVYCHRVYDEVTVNIRKHYKKELFNEMGSFAGWSFLGSSTSVISNYGQGIVLNIFFGPAVNAAQGIANQISGQLGAFSTTMLSALNPVITKNEGAGRRTSMLKMTTMGSKMSFFLLAIMCIPVIVDMPFILKFWLKEVPVFAVIFCRLLLVRNLIEQFFIPVNTSIIAVGNIKGFQITTTVINVLPLIVASIIFSFGYPPYYIYIVFVVYAVINAAISLYYGNKYCNLTIPTFLFHVVFKSLIAVCVSLIITWCCSYFVSSEILKLILIISISTISFILLFFFIGFTKDERDWILLVINSFLNKLK